MKKRLCIYVTYDSQGIIEKYVENCLKELKTVTECLIVVSNCVLDGKSREKLTMADKIYERSNMGFDVGGFSYVISDLVKQDVLKQYDEMILTNDSVFGPFFPFSEMFSEMDKRNELDFWGITKRGVSDFDGGETIYPEHIQSYFYVIRKRMIQSPDFVYYWRNITKKITDFRSAILNYEFAFTKYFADRGFKWDVYCHTDGLATENPMQNLSPYHYCTYDLVKNERCPLLKRKLFTGDFVESRFSDKADLRKAISYISEHTDYDMNLIWSHILRIYHIGDIIESMQMYEFIDEEKAVPVQRGMQIRLVDNHGTVAGKMDSDLEISDSAEYTLFISIEEKSEIPDILLKAEISCVFENLCSSSQYVAQIIDLFKKNSRLGVLVHPVNTFGQISKSIEKKWQKESVVAEMQNKYHLSVPIGKNAPIHKISAFWCRSNIVDTELLEDLKTDSTGTAMQMLPLFAQQKGYYTEVVISKNYAASLTANLQQIIRDVWDMTSLSLPEDSDIETMRDEAYRKQIVNFIKQKNKLFVYGAGQLACRTIKIVSKITKLEGVVVSDKNGNAETICGYPILEIGEADIENCNMIVAVGKKNNLIIEARLKALGVTDYIILV